MKERIFQLVNEKHDYFANLNDRIWATPELAYGEFKSCAALIESLKEFGFEVETPVAGIPTAFKAVWGKGKPVVGFLAEYDALSGLSQECGNPGHAPLEVGAPGHGCGHNALGVVCVESAVIMKQLLEETGKEGTIVVFGCPAEEQGCGKAFMAREGVFNCLDMAFAPHPMATNDLPTSSLANIQASFTFKGRPAHAAAAPEHGRSALDAAELMVIGIQFLREHVVQEARMHHAFLDVGGTAPNVVQASAKLLFYIRAPKADQVRSIFERVKKIANGAAMMTETEVDINIESAMVDLVENHVLADYVSDVWADLGAVQFSDEAKAIAATMAPAVGNNTGKLVDESVVKFNPLAPGMAGSTDVGDVSYTVPTVQINYASVAVGTPNHTWQFVAQSGTPIMHEGNDHVVKLMVLTGMKLLDDPAALEAAKAELMETTGCVYDCLIPADVNPALVEA